MMLILLPPSESKRSDADGPPLDLATLSFPELTRTRDRVLKALEGLCGRSETRARDVLGLSPGQAAEIARNRGLRTAPTLSAARLYTGVLYDNLGLATLNPDRVARSVLIFSGLWGALRVTDRVPAYRLAMGVRLPRLGPLASLWRPVLTSTLPTGDLVVDMRSAPYAAAWRPEAVNVRVFRERDGKRSVVSHMAKATRGAVARALLRDNTEPATPAQLVKTLMDLGYAAELNGSAVDIILTD